MEYVYNALDMVQWRDLESMYWTFEVRLYGLSLNQNGISQYNIVIFVLTYIDYRNIY